MQRSNQIPLDRRALLGGFVALTATTLANKVVARTLPALPRGDAAAVAADAGYWAAVRKLYAVTDEIVNLENGYWGVMAEPVRREFERHVAEVNHANSFYARTAFGKDLTAVRDAVVAALGCTPEEIALTRGATEALQILIGGYNGLKPGDAVLYADLDYDSMQYAMEWLKWRRGVEVVKIALPEPATRQAVLDAYEQALQANPKVRLLLLTHLSHRTGLVIPAAEIAAMARARNVEVIVDAAHSFAQLDFRVGDLGADFVGFNLHKWVGAPLGCGCLYIRKERLTDIDRFMEDGDWPETDIRSRVHTGTFNFATFLTIPTALALQQEIGSKAKEARLRYLRDYWVSRTRGFKGLDILTPDDPAMHGAITAFRLAGKTSKDDNNAIATRLKEEFGIFTVRRGGVAKGQCIRVTPTLYNSEADLDRLVQALAVITESQAG